LTIQQSNLIRQNI